MTPGTLHAVRRPWKRLAAVLVALPAIAPLVLMIPTMMIAIVEPFMRLSARGREHDESQQEKASSRALDVSHANSLHFHITSLAQAHVKSVDAKARAICHDRQSDGLIYLKTLLRELLCSAAAAAALLLAPWALGAGGHSPKTGASSSSSGDYNSLPTGRGALRQIVQTQCVLNWKQHHNPAPCERVTLYDQNASDVGYAILQDPAGGAHYLLVPTQTMAGLESGELLDRDAPNYFAEAWRAHDLLAKAIGRAVPRTDIGLVVNTERTRAYDQFHIHIECLRHDVADGLRADAPRIADTWAPLMVGGTTFQAMRIASDSLDGSNLYELLAALKPGVSQRLRDYTLIAVGAQFVTGPGFILLTGTGPTGEILLDSTCEAAGGGG